MPIAGKAIIAESGAEAILPYSYSGTLGLVQMASPRPRLWNRLGAASLAEICGAAAEPAVQATLGKRWSPPYERRGPQPSGHPLGAQPGQHRRRTSCRSCGRPQRGCQVVVIDPRRTSRRRGADWHLAPLPGSDGYLALGSLTSSSLRGSTTRHGSPPTPSAGRSCRERLADFPPRVAEDRVWPRRTS